MGQKTKIAVKMQFAHQDVIKFNGMLKTVPNPRFKSIYDLVKQFMTQLASGRRLFNQNSQNHQAMLVQMALNQLLNEDTNQNLTSLLVDDEALLSYDATKQNNVNAVDTIQVSISVNNYKLALAWFDGDLDQLILVVHAFLKRFLTNRNKITIDDQFILERGFNFGLGILKPTLYSDDGAQIMDFDVRNNCLRSLQGTFWKWFQIEESDIYLVEQLKMAYLTRLLDIINHVKAVRLDNIYCNLSGFNQHQFEITAFDYFNLTYSHILGHIKVHSDASFLDGNYRRAHNDPVAVSKCLLDQFRMMQKINQIGTAQYLLSEFGSDLTEDQQLELIQHVNDSIIFKYDSMSLNHHRMTIRKVSDLEAKQVILKTFSLDHTDVFVKYLMENQVTYQSTIY